MKTLAIILVSLLLHVPLANAQQSSELKVSATVLPQPCHYPDRCDDDDDDDDDDDEDAVRAMYSRLTVDAGELYYVGSPPSVATEDGVLTVIF